MAMTIEQIAKNLGVSTTTVKLVYNGKADKYRISSKTQQRVNEFIEKNGIIVNQTARSLKLKKSNTLGLVVTSVTNVFFSSLIEHFEKESRKIGYQLITVSTDGCEKKEKEVTVNLIERGVDGIFIVPSSENQQLDTIKKFTQKPIIFLDQDFKVKDQSVVMSDNYQAFTELTREILAKKVSEVYVVSGDSELPSIRARLQGFVDGYKSLNQQPVSNWLYAVPKNKFQDGYEGMQALVRENKRVPEAVVFSSLPILEGALHFLKIHKGVIPNSLVIGTFDEHTMLEFLPNTVVSVQQDSASIAHNACKLMQENIVKNPVSKRIIVPAKVISRG
ncbi:substrate-binding domain-containing protein [Vibrio sp. 99-8-1]|nr:substrate-binding domain-containing protein [Vibrio sp. 99-8-1]